MMANRGFFLLALVAIAALLVSTAVFTVSETDLAIKFRFGEIVRADYEPGLHFMTPFVNNVRKFEKRIMTRNYPTDEFLTSEGKQLGIDFYVKWRIADIGDYYRATGGDEEIATVRLGEIVKDGIKGVIARRTIQQVVTAERAEFIGEVLLVAAAGVAELGIELIDVRVKRIDLPPEVSDSVYNRMRQDFVRQATKLRAEGSETSERLKSEADRERTEILAAAYRDAEVLRGEGDSRATGIYASAYSKNAEFYAFYRSLEAYRNSIGGEGDVLVISPDSEFFRYLERAGSKR
jgi:membrane protease subunit HflC